MTGILFRLLTELGPAVTHVTTFIAALIIWFALYVGIAMVAVLCATDGRQLEIRYRVFRDLLDLFRRGRR